MALVLAYVLAVLSASLGALFLLGIVHPRRLVSVAHSVLGRTGVAGAVVVRLVLAVSLWFSAPVSSTPGGFRALAAVMLMAAFSAVVLGKDRVSRMTDRMAGWGPGLARIPIAVGLVLCVFTLWSILPAISGL